MTRNSILKRLGLYIIVAVVSTAAAGTKIESNNTTASSKQTVKAQGIKVELPKEEVIPVKQKEIAQKPNLTAATQKKQVAAPKKEVKTKVVNKVVNNPQPAKQVNVYTPQFEKKQFTGKVEFNTPWEIGNKFSATVEGKGPDAIEEGIATIIVKNADSSFSFNLINNSKQYTPKAVKWLDNENLLVIVGYGFGTVSKGGELFSLNVNTGAIVRVGNLTEITKIKSVNGNIVEVEILIYEDSQMTKSHVENRTIKI